MKHYQYDDKKEHYGVSFHYTPDAETPEFINVTLNDEVEATIAVVREALTTLRRGLSTLPSCIEFISINFTQFDFDGDDGVATLDGKYRDAELHIYDHTLWLHFRNEWTGDSYELALTDSLLVTPKEAI